MRFWRWPARWRHHRSLWCCQYIDTPLCNGALDPHPIARVVGHRRQRKDT